MGERLATDYITPILKVAGSFLKYFSMFLFLRAILYAAGFRYNIPIVDDVFWSVMNVITTWGLSGGTKKFFGL